MLTRTKFGGITILTITSSYILYLAEYPMIRTHRSAIRWDTTNVMVWYYHPAEYVPRGMPSHDTCEMTNCLGLVSHLRDFLF